MIILGIDPGTATTGFGVIRKEGNKLYPIDYGCIETKPNMAMPDRLNEILKQTEKIIKKHKPDTMACEELFFFKNAKTVITVAQARGVLIVAGRKNMVSVFEYTPLQIKQALTGYGRAEKKQIQKMVKLLLNLDKIPKPDDAADALAVAICHANSVKMNLL
ncbi:MAG: crossover junction endodeoxyribonuclease RuvC [Parcubacteria group bacterium]|nr:crossover junction endodeoxyribonuclease RuvC [Parcubacteria group bacterium]